MSDPRTTGQPYLDRLFNAAVACTGDWMPGHWGYRGQLHLLGKCKRCKAKPPAPRPPREK